MTNPARRARRAHARAETEAAKRHARAEAPEPMLIVYSDRCTYWTVAPRSKVAGLRRCPHCDARLLVATRERWLDVNTAAEKARPGWLLLVAELRDRCLPITTLDAEVTAWPGGAT